MKCKCSECELRDNCIMPEIMQSIGEETFINIIKSVKSEEPQQPTQQNLEYYRRQFEAERSAIIFWKNILLEEEDKEILEIAIDSLQYILDKVGVNVVHDIRTRPDLSDIYEKCKRLKVKYF